MTSTVTKRVKDFPSFTAPPSDARLLVDSPTQGTGSILASYYLAASLAAAGQLGALVPATSITGVVADGATGISAALSTAIAAYSALSPSGGVTILLDAPNTPGFYIDERVEIRSNVTLWQTSGTKITRGARGHFSIRGELAEKGDGQSQGRLRANATAGGNVVPLLSGHAGSAPDLYPAGSLIRLRGLGGGVVAVDPDTGREDAFVDSVAASGDDWNLVLEDNLQNTYYPEWDSNTYAEAAEYEAIYGEPDRTYIERLRGCKLTANLTAGDASFTVSTANASLFARGQVVTLKTKEVVAKADGSSSSNLANVELNMVADVDTDTGVVTLAWRVRRSMTTANDAHAVVVEPCRNAGLWNIETDTIAAPDGSKRYPTFEIAYGLNCWIKDCRALNTEESSRGSSFRVYWSLNCRVEGCYAALPLYLDSGEAYCFEDNKATGTRFVNCTGYGGRHTFVWQGTTNGQGSNLMAFGPTLSGFDVHGQNEIGLLVDNWTVCGTSARAGTTLSPTTTRSGLTLGNTSHLGGCSEIEFRNGHVHDMPDEGDRAVTLRCNVKHSRVLGLRVRNVYTGVYATIQTDGTNPITTVPIEDVTLGGLDFQAVLNKGIDINMGADAGSYQMRRLTIDGLRTRGTDRPCEIRKSQGLRIAGLDIVGSTYASTDPYALRLRDIASWNGDDEPGGVVTGGQITGTHKGIYLENSDVSIAFVALAGLGTEYVVVDAGGNTGVVQKLAFSHLPDTAAQENVVAGPSGGLTVDLT